MRHYVEMQSIVFIAISVDIIATAISEFSSEDDEGGGGGGGGGDGSYFQDEQKVGRCKLDPAV